MTRTDAPAPPTGPAPKTFTIELSFETYRQLLHLIGAGITRPTSIEEILKHLARCAADGVRRPGSWERSWVEQAFGDIQ